MPEADKTMEAYAILQELEARQAPLKRPLCIYHAGCHDGFGAAWAVRKWHINNNIELDFWPTGYGSSPPDVLERKVIIVDFSYKLPIMRAILDRASSVLILDHHKTAQGDLEILFSEKHSKLSGKFDMEHSGAMLAWQHYFPDDLPDSQAPNLLRAIEDRDLWRFQIPGSRNAHANLSSYPMDFDLWDKLMSMDLMEYTDFCNEGSAIDRAKLKNINEWIKTAKQEMRIAGFNVPVINGPAEWSSDAGHIMCKGRDFAATYWQQDDKKIFSLRSTDEGIDVSIIAKRFGGGGHRNAAGFAIGYDSWPDTE